MSFHRNVYNYSLTKLNRTPKNIPFCRFRISSSRHRFAKWLTKQANERICLIRGHFFIPSVRLSVILSVRMKTNILETIIAETTKFCVNTCY